MVRAIGREITVRAFGESGRLLFEMKFEPSYSRKKYYSILKSLYGNNELTDLFEEPVSCIFVQENESANETRRIGGMTVSLYSGKNTGKWIEVPAKPQITLLRQGA